MASGVIEKTRLYFTSFFIFDFPHCFEIFPKFINNYFLKSIFTEIITINSSPMRNFIAILVFLTTTFLYSQNHKVIGNVKSIREKTIFEKEPLKVEYIEEEDGTLIKRKYREDTFYSYGPYGEFFNKENELKNFNEYWYHNPYSSFLNYYMTFSKTGKKIDEIWYDEEDEKYDTSKNFYNEKDSLALQIDPSYINDSTKYFYNEVALRLKIMINEYNGKKDVDSLVYFYNNNKKLIREDHFSNGKYGFSKFYKYNSNNNLIEDFIINDSIVYKENKAVPIEEIKNVEKFYKSRFEYIYDTQNRLITKNVYQSEDKKLGLFYQSFYEYDKFDNIIKISDYSNKSKSFRLITKFIYENKLLIYEERMNNAAPEWNSSRKYYYDQKQNIIKSEIYDYKKNFVTTYKYKFDRKGNYKKIIKKTTCDGVTKKIVLVREIKYYN